MSRPALSAAELTRQASSSYTQHREATKPDVTLDSSSLSIDLSNDGADDASSGQWSETFDDDNRYSSTSTLCSGNDDLCSFSCSCCSEVLAGYETDDDMLMCGQSPPSRARSHSLMELRSGARPAYLGLHATSADNLLTSKGFSRRDLCPMNSHLRGVSLGDIHARQPYDANSPYLDDDTPTDDDDSLVNGIPWSGPPSTVSAQLSDAESEHYHTATSDLSEHYSTAKTDLSSVATEPEAGCKSRSLSFDLSLAACPTANASDRVFEWTRTSQGGSDSDQDSLVTVGQYHTFHGREDGNKYDRLPRCGSGKIFSATYEICTCSQFNLSSFHNNTAIR